MFSKKCYEYWNVVGSMSLVGGFMITVICLMTENSINSLEKDYHYGVPEPIQWNYTNCQIKSVNLVEEIPGLAFDRVIVEIPSGYQINSDSWCCAIGEFRYVRTVNWTQEQYGNYTANLRKRFVPGESREFRHSPGSESDSRPWAYHR